MASSQPLAVVNAPDAEETWRWRRTFYVMSMCFGLNHAAVTLPVGYASSILGEGVGQASNAALYGVCMLASLFVGPLAASSLGPKWSLVLGMVLYCAFVMIFAVASYFPENSSQAWILAVVGSTIGGVGAGTLWTGQGAFFSVICERLADARSRRPLQEITSELAATFALFYLGEECFWKVLFTVLQSNGVSNLACFVFYGALAGLATLVLATSNDARPRNPAPQGRICAKAMAAVKLWSDPKIWLISGNNIAFGFSAGYVNGYVNGTWLKEAVNNTNFIGSLGALVCLVATASSKLYGSLSEKLGTKVPVLLFGSSCFIAIAVLSFISAPEGKGPGGWGWGIVVFYVLQGLGRGVYESTNKGIFGDVFPGEQGVGAFANCMMQNTLAGTISFAMGALGANYAQVWIMLFFSVVSVPGLLLAQSMKRKVDSDVDPRLEGPVAGA
eukprot:CAMPEP_0117485624 /NCGR_PEP_ID=MMETSP0784-20121206/15060_1 /TAXON_ID=39447 /ORGANISM="" /LENGTH=443 /DNA_ID=CAMNT_0005280215 /DNA_START=9 /DNA_END=1340 /DNA_ORIENTATION=-